MEAAGQQQQQQLRHHPATTNKRPTLQSAPRLINKCEARENTCQDATVAPPAPSTAEKRERKPCSDLKTQPCRPRTERPPQPRPHLLYRLDHGWPREPGTEREVASEGGQPPFLFRYEFVWARQREVVSRSLLWYRGPEQAFFVRGWLGRRSKTK